MSPTAQIWHPPFYDTPPSMYVVLCHPYTPLCINIAPNVTAFHLPGHCPSTGTSSTLVCSGEAEESRKEDRYEEYHFPLEKRKRTWSSKSRIPPLHQTTTQKWRSYIYLIQTDFLLPKQCQKLTKRSILLSCL